MTRGRRKFWQDRSSTGRPRLQRRGSRFYLRAKIPEDLVEAYRRPPDDPLRPGALRYELITRLEALDLDEAKLEAEGLSHVWNLEFRDKRKRLRGAELEALGVRTANVTDLRRAETKRRSRMKEVKVVTRAIAERIRYSLVRRLLDLDAENRIDPDRRTLVEFDAGERTNSIAAWRECIKTGKTEPFHESARIEASLYGYKVPGDAEGLLRRRSARPVAAR